MSLAKSTPWRLCSAVYPKSALLRRWPAGCLSSPYRDVRWTSTHLNPASLHHQHLRGDGPGGLVSYDVAEMVQEQHRSDLLAWKALPEPAKVGNASPSPRLISFESQPTFTLGRRQDDLLPEQMARLEKPLLVDLTRRLVPVSQVSQPRVVKTNRGGLTTYHGPGQLVLWPVLDMHSRSYAKYGVASYAAHLEATTRRLLADVFRIQSYSILDEPGVWVKSASGSPRKIAAMGVHHRRYVTALGIAINIDVPVRGPEEINPWARFVPCGLEGKLVTSVAAEVGDRHTEAGDLAELAKRWGAIFEEGLRDEAKRTGEKDVRPLAPLLGFNVGPQPLTQPQIGP